MHKIGRRKFVGGSAAILAIASLGAVGCGDSEPLVSLQSPAGTQSQALVVQEQLVAFSREGVSYRLDFTDFTVARLDRSGQVDWQVGGLGDGTGLFNFPVALDSDDQGLLYVADRGNGEVDVLQSSNGSLVRSFGRGELFSARDIAVDGERQRVYVADGPNHRIAVFDLQGTLLDSIGEFGLDDPEQLNFPSGVAVAPNGDIHVVDNGNGHVQVYTETGVFQRAYGSFGESLGQFESPRSVAVTSEGESLVADSLSGFVTRFDQAGQPLDRFQLTLSNGTPVQPLYLSISPADLIVVSGPSDFVPA